jgi:hypothetical protein
MKKITVLFPIKKITLMYTMYPFWVNRNSRQFDFYSDLGDLLQKDTNKILIIVGFFHGKEFEAQHIATLKELRNRYRKIVFFDDNDGSESHYLNFLPYLDLYYKKQIFKDLELYRQSFYGNRIFTDYYNQHMGVTEPSVPEPLPTLKDTEDLKKIRVFWNLAFGQYPVSKRNFQIGKILYPFLGTYIMNFLSPKFPKGSVPEPKLSKCQARFRSKEYRHSVAFQRKLFLEQIGEDQNFLTGLVPLDTYNKELKDVQAILSPFGWGEICFRDIEAFLSGAVLVKPTVDHIETWPNLFIPNETYVPVKWDGSDLVNTVNDLLADSKRMERIKNNAWLTLKNGYADLDKRFNFIMDEIRS